MSGCSRTEADGRKRTGRPSIPPAFEAYGDEALPQAPAAGPGKSGVLEATLAREGSGDEGGETRLTYDHVKVPYHLTGTLATDPVPGLTTLVAQEPTGGAAQGDRHRIEIDARSGARAHVTTQGATKVHSMKANYAHLDADLRAGSGAYLEYLPGPTILNEDSRCLQTLSVELADDAVVIVGDVLVPDGLSDHEAFGFDHYQTRVEARHDGRLVCADTVDLRPAQREPRDPASVGEYEVVGTLYVFAPGEPVDDVADRIHDRLEAVESSGSAETTGESDEGRERDEQAQAKAQGIHAGVSTLAYDAGVVVRVLGTREADVTSAIREAWDETRRTTLGVGAPADRRY
ncbi:urease accessory protein UreD [Halobacteria archaeon AArc-m2/3/4]|uniref:Urease accessory protein UreD n=1 Tax=Natronoglomus mannanivorans TaxID=2979990 RepID=A0ABT2QF06_9EURY|nr:urease accessory protein UreD [Halobacteria archaeon AArc-m2/3/4]